MFEIVGGNSKRPATIATARVLVRFRESLFPYVRKSRTTAVRRKKRVTARYFDRGHSRGLFLLAIDSNQRCRDALLGMTDDRGEAWLSPLYWCTVEPLLGSLLTLSASPIGTRCQDTEVITPCTRLCAVGILWLSENRLPQILLPRATTCSPHCRSHEAISHSPWLRFAIGEYGFV